MRPGYGHTLRYLGASRVAMIFRQPFLPTCYGSELYGVTAPASHVLVQSLGNAPSRPSSGSLAG